MSNPIKPSVVIPINESPGKASTKLKKTEKNAPDRRVSHHQELFETSNTAFATIASDQQRSIIGSFIAVVVETIEHIRARRGHTDSKYVVCPNDPFRKVWDMIILTMIMYTATFTPFQISFYGDRMSFTNIAEWPITFCLDRIVDTVFCIDIVVNFRSAKINDEGLLEFNPKVVARQYIKSWLFFDVISVLPFDMLVLLPSIGANRLFRLPKLLRLGRLAKVIRILGNSTVVRRFEETTSLKYGWIRLMKFVILIISISHWMACSIFFGSMIGDDASEGWVHTAGLDTASVAEQYAASMYWAVMTLTTVGYGDIVAHTKTERWLFSVLMLFSAGVYAYIVGTMCSLVQGLDASNLEFQHRMDEVNEFMNKCRLPKPVCYRIRKYMLYKKKAIISTHEVMHMMSPAIQSEVALYNYEKILASVPQFRGAPPGFLAAIALALKPVVFGPNELILTIGRTSNSMYILNKGRVQWERLDKQGRIIVVRILHRCEYLGERAILKRNCRSDSSFRTLTFVESCELRKHDVDPIMKEHPQVRRIVQLSLMKEILFRNMRNGCLRHMATNADYLSVRRLANMSVIQESKLKRVDSLSDTEFTLDDAKLSLGKIQEDLERQRRDTSKLNRLVLEQNENIKELIRSLH